jgi:hypothetical protein
MGVRRLPPNPERDGVVNKHTASAWVSQAFRVVVVAYAEVCWIKLLLIEETRYSGRDIGLPAFKVPKD